MSPQCSRKGGAIGLQPHMILRVFHRIQFFVTEIAVN